MQKITIHSNDHKDGVHTFKDVRKNPGWGDVVSVQEHRSHNGKLYTVINHRNYDEALKMFYELDAK